LSFNIKGYKTVIPGAVYVLPPEIVREEKPGRKIMVLANQHLPSGADLLSYIMETGAAVYNNSVDTETDLTKNIRSLPDQMLARFGYKERDELSKLLKQLMPVPEEPTHAIEIREGLFPEVYFVERDPRAPENPMWYYKTFEKIPDSHRTVRIRVQIVKGKMTNLEQLTWLLNEEIPKSKRHEIFDGKPADVLASTQKVYEAIGKHGHSGIWTPTAEILQRYATYLLVKWGERVEVENAEEKTESAVAQIYTAAIN
jgi:hypothetical protein